MPPITITLNQVYSHHPCHEEWTKLLTAQGKSAPDDMPFPLSSLLDSNGLADTLWALRCLPEHDALWRKYAVWCARQVEHLMTDERSRTALDVAWRYACGEATEGELRAAWAAAWAAARAARDAARAAARAARDAAWAAARTAGADAAARTAGADAAAWAARDAARGAGADAAAMAAGADAAAWAAAWAAQTGKLREILNAGEWV